MEQACGNGGLQDFARRLRLRFRGSEPMAVQQAYLVLCSKKLVSDHRQRQVGLRCKLVPRDPDLSKMLGHCMLEQNRFKEASTFPHDMYDDPNSTEP